MANRTIKFYKQYFQSFYIEQKESVRKKITYCLNMVKNLDRVPASILKKMEDTDGLFEIRVMADGNIFRIFCCFDEGNLVILFNGFQKKTQKTPREQIERANQLMKEYFKEKQNE